MGDTLSPFIPGTKVQFAWDSTSLGWLKECPRKYYYSMIEGWRARENSVHLDFGIWYHSALELYDHLRSGSSPATTVDHNEAVHIVVRKVLEWTWTSHEATDEEPAHGQPWSPDHTAKNRETLIRSVVWYLDHFKDDAAVTYKLADGRPAVELSFRFELDYGPELKTTHVRWDLEIPEITNYDNKYILSGHLDRIVEYQGSLYVMDRKTMSSYIGPRYFDQFEPNNQMTLYTLASQLVFGAPVRGVIIDAAQVQVNATQFGRGMTYRTERQLEEWLDDTRYWLRQAEAFAEANYWPMNDTSCHKYGGCPFREVCSKDPAVRDVWLQGGFVKKHWNPLEAR